jgi:pyruvate kinase
VYGILPAVSRRAKIVCTLGPACDSAEGLKDLIDAGMDVARFNFSHGSHEEHGNRLTRLREASTAKKKAVAALGDLCGPKIRTGTCGRFDLPDNAEVRLVEGEKSPDERTIAIAHEGLAGDVRPGDRILFDDGRIVLLVKGVEPNAVQCVVEQGGGMRDRIGVHLPSRSMKGGALTEKDKADLLFGLSQGIDYIALSFVRRSDDLKLVREICAAWGADVPIIAKIETPDAVDNLEATLPIIAKLERPQAVEHLQDILASCDGVMVARGDLGLELPFERVPGVQKAITREARRRGVPVIVATQVLESMTTEPRPTRAEVNDAANAVEDGVDAIMLAGETAIGKFPVRAVQALGAIVCDAEQRLTPDSPAVSGEALGDDHAQALCEAAVTLANRGDAQAIVAVTRGGSTARRLSALRPRAPILAATNGDDTLRRLAL